MDDVGEGAVVGRIMEVLVLFWEAEAETDVGSVEERSESE